MPSRVEVEQRAHLLGPGGEDDAPDSVRVDLDVVAEIVAGETSGRTIMASDDEVEMRYFGGLSVEATAAALRVSPQTAMRDWTIARTCLAARIGG